MSKTRNIRRNQVLFLFLAGIVKDVPPFDFITPFSFNRPVAIAAEGVFYTIEISTTAFEFIPNILKRLGRE